MSLKTTTASRVVWDKTHHPRHSPTASVRSSLCLPFVARYGHPGNCSGTLPPAPGPLYVLRPPLSHIRLPFFTTRGDSAVTSPEDVAACSPTQFTQLRFSKVHGNLNLDCGLQRCRPPHPPPLSHRTPELLEGGMCGWDTLSAQNKFQISTLDRKKKM